MIEELLDDADDFRFHEWMYFSFFNYNVINSSSRIRKSVIRRDFSGCN